MKERIEDTTLKTLFRLEPISQEQMEERRRQRAAAAARPRFQMEIGPAAAAASGAPPSPFAPRQAGPPQPAKPQTVVRQGDKVGRNDPCPVRLGEEVQEVPRRGHTGGDLVAAQGTAGKISRHQSALARFPAASLHSDLWRSHALG